MNTPYDHMQYATDRVRNAVRDEQMAGFDSTDAILRVAERYGIDPFKLRDVLRP